MFQSHFRILPGDLLYDFSPQSGRVQYICFVHTCHFSAALHSYVKCPLRDPPDLVLIVRERIIGCHHPVFLHGPALSKVETSCQLTHDHHIKPAFCDLFFQRTGAFQFFIENSGPQIGKKIQRFADLQKSCLRPLVRLQLIPGRGLCISSYRSHKHRVTLLCSANRVICERHAVHIDGCSAHKQLIVIQCMSVYFSHFI